jgi:cellobiose phosphorylase
MHQWMLGIRKEYDGLTIAPQIPSEWNEACVDMSFRGKALQVKIQRNGEKQILLNGKKIDGNRILTEMLEDKNELIVNI